MDLINKLHNDVAHAGNSLLGIEAFSTKDRILIFLIILFPIIINNLLYWFLQDVLITQLTVTIFGYFLAPALLNRCIKKDVYVLLDFKERIPQQNQNSGWIYSILALFFPAAYLALVLFLGKVGVSSLNLLAAYFSSTYGNYAYIIISSILFGLIHPYFESRFYFGIVDSILPSGLFWRIVLALLHTSNYIGFSLALVGPSVLCLYPLGLFFLTHLFFAFVASKRGVRTAMVLFVISSLLVLATFLAFVYLKHSKQYLGGVNLVMPNPRNVFA